MGKTYTPQPLTSERKEQLRAIIRDAKWKTASSARYRTAPHSYIICFKDSPAHHPGWQFFDKAIRECGEYRTWKGHRYKYLIIDSFAYWVDFPALNRAKADTLDSLK